MQGISKENIRIIIAQCADNFHLFNIILILSYFLYRNYYVQEKNDKRYRNDNKHNYTGIEQILGTGLYYLIDVVFPHQRGNKSVSIGNCFVV